MKAVTCKRYGSPEVLEIVDVPVPKPKLNQVLIKVQATSVNSGDVRLRGLDVGDLPGAVFVKFIMRCIVGFKAPRKKILGMVLAGEVVEVGGVVSKFKVGDKVYAMTGFALGAFAEYAVVGEEQSIAHMPKAPSFEEASSLVFGGATALYFLRKAGIESAKRVLVYGASGAVGTAAVQVASYYGAEVTAVSGEDGMTIAKDLGATTVYDYRKQSVADIQGQFDIVFDAVGKISKAEVAHLLATGARYVTVGGMDTAKETAADLELLAKWFDEGKFKAVIDRVYDLEEMVEAQRYVETGRKKGSVVVRVRS